LRCVRKPHHCGHVGYKVTNATTCDCHFTQKNMTKEKFQVMILKKETLKLLILGSPMGIPTHLICLPKFFLSFLVQWRGDIEDLVSFIVTCLKCLFHLQNVYLQCMMHNWYGNHLAQWNVHLHFPFGRHLMLIQDLLMDNLDCFVKGHGFNNLNNK